MILGALLAAVMFVRPTLAQQGERQHVESWDEISSSTLHDPSIRLPLARGQGPSVLKAQILLDRALFSPRILDGKWGKNTAKAVRWFQEREGLPATGRLDRITLERLRELAGAAEPFVLEHRLTDGEVRGPFVEIPEAIYAKAEMECMCFESMAEKLGERFHTSPAVLRQLNPGIDLNALAAGERILVPNVRDEQAAQDVAIERIVISDGGHYLHALDPSGRLVLHFPSTLGSDYAPSPTGEFRITSITRRPTWYYQPDLLTGVDDSRPPAFIPPGPNNAVGLVWMELSKPHYGIHGTSAPATIGYVDSHGCVRLTNWDALFLADRIEAGTPVEFVQG